MYCSRCGKKILESMLFCPFCGSEIVIPDQDDAAPVPSASPASETTAPAFDDRTFLWNEREPDEEKPPEIEPADKAEEASVSWDKSAEVPALPESPPGQDFAPPMEASKEENKPVRIPKSIEGDRPLDIFMEHDGEEPQDDFDAFEAAQAQRRSRRQMSDGDEDEEHEGFFHRHMRGVIAFALILALAAGLAVFAMSETGQQKLAKLDIPLPIKPEIYSKLGFEEYQAKNYKQSGIYYERALAREPDSFDYASSAAMAYIAHGDTEKATAMLKKCIELRPKAVEPYIYLIRLYPEADQRPAEVSQLLEQGYQLTGDARLQPLEPQEPRYIEMQ